MANVQTAHRGTVPHSATRDATFRSVESVRDSLKSIGPARTLGSISLALFYEGARLRRMGCFEEADIITNVYDSLIDAKTSLNALQDDGGPI